MGKHRKARPAAGCSTQVMGAVALMFVYVVSRAGQAVGVQDRRAALGRAARRELTVAGTALMAPFAGLAAVTGLPALVTTELAQRGWKRLHTSRSATAGAGERGRHRASPAARGGQRW